MNMKGRPQGYTVPALSAREIVQYLRENEFNVVESDLLLPTPGYICKLYEGVLTIFAEEQVGKYTEESLSIMHTYYLMRNFMQKIGFPGLQIKDITHPDAQRALKILSAVVSFATFKETKKRIYADVYRKRKEIENAIEDTEQRIKQQTELLRRRMQEKESVQKQIREIEKEISKQEREIIDFHRVKQGILTEIEKVKEDLTAVTKKISTDKCQIIETTQEISRLQTQIVKNPEQLRELLIGMKMQLKGEESILQEYEKKIAYLHKTVSYFKGASEDIKSLMCTASLAAEYKERHSNAETYFKQLSHENQNLETERSAKEAEKGMVDRKVAYIIDKMANLNAETEERLRAARKEFDSLREKHSTVIQERANMQAMIQQNNQEIKQLEKEIVEAESMHESRLSSLHTALAQKKAFLQSYAEDIDKVVRGEYSS